MKKQRQSGDPDPRKGNTHTGEGKEILVWLEQRSHCRCYTRRRNDTAPEKGIQLAFHMSPGAK